MSNKPHIRPEVTREVIEHYISEARRMQSEEIHALARLCFSFVSKLVKGTGRGLSQAISTVAAKLRERTTVHNASHAKQ